MYRLNFLCRATGGIIPLLATIYEGKGGGQIEGYGLSQLIGDIYYLRPAPDPAAKPSVLLHCPIF